MLNDEWTLTDHLNHTTIVEKIIDTIKVINPPFSLGIYGGWGSGKTSIMKQTYYLIGGTKKYCLFPHNDVPISEEISSENQEKINEIQLEENQKFNAIWFNPWKHEVEENPLLGLLHEIRDHFSIYNKTTDEAKKLAHVTIRSGLDILTNTIKNLTKIDISPSNIEKYGMKYEENNFEIKSNTQNFRLIFEASIKKLLEESPNKKLIIFIDDLDRCTDQKIIKLLEGIKLYLSTSNCMFIFGMDKKNVENALKNNNIKEDYLDKLFQSVIRIPSSEHYKKFIKKSIIEKTFVSLGTTQQNDLTTLLTDIIEHNPRKIKNFSNSLKFHWDILTKNSNEAEFNLIICTLIHYLRIYYEDILLILEQDSNHLSALQEICKHNSANSVIESYFAKLLHNPIGQQVSTNSTGLEAGAIVNNNNLSNEEYITIKNTQTRFCALENFKKNFIKYTENMNSNEIKPYLGIL